jgi:AcrR family transcriptional regulator
MVTTQTAADEADAPPSTEARALLDAGLKVIRRNGYEGATVGDILSEAGLSTRAFYRHFESKDELLCALYRRDATWMIQRIATAVDAAASPLEGLHTWVDSILAIMCDPRRAARAALLDSPAAQRAKGFHDEERRAHLGFIEPLRRVITAGVEADVFVSPNHELDASTINAILWALVKDFPRTGQSLTRSTVREQVLRFAEAGLGVGGPRRCEPREKSLSRLTVAGRVRFEASCSARTVRRCAAR